MNEYVSFFALGTILKMTIITLVESYKILRILAYMNDIEFMIILIIRQIIHRLPHFLIQMHQGSLKLEFGKNIVRTFLKLHEVKT